MSRLIFIPFIILITACSVSQKISTQKRFNEDEFPGFVQMEPDSKGIMLDYELDGTDGQPLKFLSCSQVKAAPDEAVVPHQFKLLRLLRINCSAAETFLRSDDFSHSFFPQTLTESFASELPAQAVPSRGGDALDMRKDALMGSYEKNLRIDNIDRNRVSVTLTNGDKITYLILARVDIDGDDNEDWIMRLDWSSPNSFGDGSDLIVLSKRSMDDDYIVHWRYK